MTDFMPQLYQQMVAEHMAKGAAQGWGYFPPLSIYAQIVEEMGELARILNRLYGKQKPKTDEVQRDLEEEFAGVLFALVCQANAADYKLSAVELPARCYVESPLILLARLVASVAELGNLLITDPSQWQRPQDYLPIWTVTTINQALAMLKCMARHEHIDLQKSLADYIAKIAERDAKRWQPEAATSTDYQSMLHDGDFMAMMDEVDPAGAKRIRDGVRALRASKSGK